MNSPPKTNDTDEFNQLYHLLSQMSEKNKTSHPIPSHDNVEELIQSISKPLIPVPLIPVPIAPCILNDASKEFVIKDLDPHTLEDKKTPKRKYARKPPIIRASYPPIHQFVYEALQKSTHGVIPLQCRFCEVQLSNESEHIQHFIISSSCNRMAIEELKMLLTS
jgi:hypothetical protein